MAFGLFSRPRAIAAAAAGYAQARMRLLQIETAEAGREILLVLLISCAGLLLLALAHVMILTGLVVLAQRLWHWDWSVQISVLAVLHAGLGCWLLSKARARLALLQCFEETRRQFQEDQACLSPSDPTP